MEKVKESKLKELLKNISYAFSKFVTGGEVDTEVQLYGELLNNPEDNVPSCKPDITPKSRTSRVQQTSNIETVKVPRTRTSSEVKNRKTVDKEDKELDI